MNSSRYILARLALSFGLNRKGKRLTEAADELHLLRQAEEILGEEIWEHMETVDEVGVHYWNLRKYQIAIDKLEEQINIANESLDASQEIRNDILNQANEQSQPIAETRDELLKKSEKLTAKRDEIVARAQQIKRRIEASQTKLSVIVSENESDGNQAIIQAEQEKLAQFKADFILLKKERESVGHRIKDLDQELAAAEAELGDDRKRLREEAAVAYQGIGKANRNKSKLRAEVGVIEVEMRQHFHEIGKYASTHIDTEPVCAELCKEHSQLSAQIQTLRNSIALNHKLAAQADGWD